MAYRIALVPGDGIGPEVCGAAADVLKAVADRSGCEFEFSTYLAGGCALDKYGVPLPQETVVRERIAGIVAQGAGEVVDVAVELCLYCMKAQVFLDGNKRAAIIFANHYLIAHGGGLLVVPESDVVRFKELLIGHYEGIATEELAAFMKERCWRRLD